MCEEPRHAEDEVSHPIASTPPARPPRPPRPAILDELQTPRTEQPYYSPPTPPPSSCIPLTPTGVPLTPNSSSESFGYSNLGHQRAFFTRQSISENSLPSNQPIRPPNYGRSNSSASYTYGSNYQRANSFNETR